MLKNYIIGLDIGGSNVRGILWDERKIIRSYKIDTPKSKREFQNKISALAASLAFRKKILGLGVSVAGVVSGTRIVKSPNIKYLDNFEFKSLGFGKIKVDNDARCFLRGELTWKSDFQVRKNVLGIAIGTGIGRAYAENGSVKKIKKLEYPELWERKFQKIRDKRDYEKLVKFLGEKLNIIIKKYRPSEGLIGGGVLGRKIFFESLKKELQSKNVGCKIIRSKVGEYAGAIGAVKLFK